MKLRFTGSLTHDIEWRMGRLPAVAELLYIDGSWHRVTMVAWVWQSGTSDFALLLNTHKTDTPGFPVPDGN